jgi:ABC-2 type transport system ATP-binding protein
VFIPEAVSVSSLRTNRFARAAADNAVAAADDGFMLLAFTGPLGLTFPVLILAALGWVGYAVAKARHRSRARGNRSSRPSGPMPRPTDTTAPGAADGGDADRATATVASPRPSGTASLPGRGPDYWAIEARGLTKWFGAHAAVDDVELLVPRGSAFGYLGPNGAGKTTLIRLLLGLTRADSGTMSLLGLPVPGERERALARVGAIVEEPRCYGHLTGRENLEVLAAVRGGEADRQIAPALDRTRLTQRADDKVSTYSMGMRQRLGVAACLLADPQLLILDEPMNGMDPAGIHEMRDMIRSLVDEGRTVLLSSHLLDEVERTCDQVAIVDRGQVIRQGPIDQLIGEAGVSVEVQCSDPPAAARALGQLTVASGIALGEHGLTVTLTPGQPQDKADEITRRLVEAGIPVHGVRLVHASLEDWFLSVTSRLGED